VGTACTHRIGDELNPLSGQPLPAGQTRNSLLAHLAAAGAMANGEAGPQGGPFVVRQTLPVAIGF
jgi:hypothetical protein